MNEETPKREIRISKWSIVSVVLLIVLIILLSVPNYINKSNCEVARPGYKCETMLNVIRENCAYLKTNNFTDESIVWYVEQLCPLQNQYHNSKLDCSSARQVCYVI